MLFVLLICFFFFFNDTATTEIYTLSLHDALPIFLDVAEHALAEEAVEGFDPVFLDLSLGLEPELLLDGKLHGQPVGIPPALSRHSIALHRLVAREQVFEGARQHVVDARSCVRRGRPLVEHVGPLLRPQIDALAEDIILLPEAQDIFLQLRETLFRIDWSEHACLLRAAHSPSIKKTRP